MTMEDILGNMVKAVDGAMGAMVGGFDGMVVAAVVTNDQINIAEIAAGIAMALRYVQKVANETRVGDVEEMLVETAGGTFYLKPINSDYWIGMILAPDAIIGKAKLEMKKAIPKMVKEVS